MRIIGVIIATLLIGSYFFLKSNSTSIEQKKNLDTKNIISYSKDSINKKESIKNIVDNKDILSDKKSNKKYIQLNKKSDDKKDSLITEIEYDDIQLSESINSKDPLDIFEDIMNLKQKDINKQDVILQKEIASLESNLIYQLQNMPGVKSYDMFKKYLEVDSKSEEDIKYIVAFLNEIGLEDTKRLLAQIYITTNSSGIKNKISSYNIVEVDILDILLNNNSSKIDELKNRSDKELIKAFINISKANLQISLDSIISLVQNIYSNKVTKKTVNLVQDYLGESNVKQEGRVVLLSVLSNIKDQVYKDEIFSKILEYETSPLIIKYLHKFK